MARAEVPAALRVEVCWSPQAGEVECVALELPAGATVAEALRASGLAERHPAIAEAPVGVWGKLKSLETLLRDLDRVEIYRPLRVDPKEARRLRYRQHRERYRKAGEPSVK